MKESKGLNVIGVIVLQIILTGISTVIPYGYKTILDDYIKTGEIFDYRVIFLIIFIGILSYILNIFFVSYWQEKLIISQGTEYQKKAFSKIIKMPQHGYEELGSSFLMNSIIVDGEQAARYDFVKNIQILGYMVNGGILFLILLFINPIFAIISMVGILFYYVLLNFQGKSLGDKNRSLMNSQDNLLSTIKHYVINNIAIVKSENILFFDGKFMGVFKRWIKDKLDLAFLQSTIQKIPMTISLSLPLIILYLGTGNIRSGAMTLGTLMMFIQIQSLMFIPATRVSNSMADLKVLKVHKDRFDKIYTIFQEQGINSDGNSGITMNDTEIKTQDGRLLYKGSFSIGENGFYIIKGANGTGKSTLLRAVIGNLGPEQVKGQISISKNLLKNISFLKYPLFLFDDNVLQNIKGAPNVESEIDMDEISRFNPPNLKKKIQLDPLNLSSGEAQKVILLREIIKESNMILLDEPTTNLDSETVSEFKDYVERKKEDKLIISIMHDDSFDSIADGFIFIEDKKLWMEDGNV